MTGPVYHFPLQHQVLPDRRANNRGELGCVDLDKLWSPCHVTNRNMAYLDRQFGDRVVSRKPVRGRDLLPALLTSTHMTSSFGASERLR